LLLLWFAPVSSSPTPRITLNKTKKLLEQL